MLHICILVPNIVVFEHSPLHGVTAPPIGIRLLPTWTDTPMTHWRAVAAGSSNTTVKTRTRLNSSRFIMMMGKFDVPEKTIMYRCRQEVIAQHQVLVYDALNQCITCYNSRRVRWVSYSQSPTYHSVIYYRHVFTFPNSRWLWIKQLQTRTL